MRILWGFCNIELAIEDVRRRKLPTTTNVNTRFGLNDINYMKTNMKQVTAALGCLLLITGCAQMQQQGKYTPSAQVSASAPAPSANMAYFPSGTMAGSGLSVEKTAPAQVLVGQPYEYTYMVSNMSDATLENVVVMDRVSSDFTASDPRSPPRPARRTARRLGTWAPSHRRKAKPSSSKAAVRMKASSPLAVGRATIRWCARIFMW